MSDDTNIEKAIEQVNGVLAGNPRAPHVKAFFHEPTFTATYVVSDDQTKRAAIIDSVWDFDQPSGRTSLEAADEIIDYVREAGLTVDWILETHAHADHLSAAPYLQEKLGGEMAIGRDIVTVQGVFGKVFNEGTEFERDGSQFDRLLEDGDELMIGDIPLIALHVPGHTPADIAYIVGDAAFIGDTMFMPDYGSARADFPGGNARNLYRSVRRLMRLPDKTRVFLCHDYKAPNRTEFVWETTMLAQRTANVHLHEDVDEDEFVDMRTQRDATLEMPRLILPAIQVNMRGGHLPPPEDDGTSYLKMPVNKL
ncbi:MULTISPECIES: MBL fold metallo-hydrolase [Erythrobacteraceae]|jgi:glyoxylase-like metal-dependent hydrolase (beta-lactamase superfamily II)|uniref:Beta-lactamase n=4 Tax=Erythrobacteraceae TaxID=335929 RepID=A0A160HUM8_9SPHN|nr:MULTISPECIES: MBL fold metallo-hydrolase [Erythrobacteraceae]KZX53270.1 MBL fold metallo-hydrolase [Erythrobacter sp. HI00D59]KZX87088.1 MBL fold metallo-hydrolase [Erythrobacter sp. HI0020]KZY15614.1 MBL fold metallo-hydrolase [Erythrobacter sp. HI0037]KZY16968.1 MBL fold metallo-hydrolase [Erythrobacter sp. HI0038]MAO96444.1 MBL fold metallo-hydrolase [Citromicrobium sp.]MEC9108968.1 MBL fold metallo-hydrolase [Pseudomonadota bacterium]|tara:strand:- start:307 stop:1236 length:930 start_codon:yes stop_codon:yes gene_type:complete